MANYKSGYKRKGSDRFISYILMGFAVTFFIIIVSLILYNVFSKSLDYSSFDRIEDYSLIDEMPEDEYLVYYYTVSCYYCKEIKEEVLDFADDNNRGIKVYFIDAENVTGTNYIAGMDGTPSLLTVINGQIVNLVGGATDIPNTFRDINNGSYLYFN